MQTAKTRATERGALEAVDWGDITKRLTMFAYRKLPKGQGWETARDIAQEAIMQLLDPAYSDWNPAKETLLRHLGSVVNGLLSNHRQKHSTKREKLAKDDRAVDSSRHPVDERSAERELSEHQFGQLAMTRLREKLAGDDLAIAVLDLFGEGVELAREQGERLEAPMDLVYRARRKLDQRASQVLAELEQEIAS